MIEGCRDAIGIKKSREFFRPFTAAHIYDSRACDIGTYAEQLAGFIFRATDDIGEIRSFEPTLNQAFILKAKPFHDIFRDLRSGRCRKRDDRCIYHITKSSDLKIIRTEIISPLRDAMSLIHDNETDIHLLKVISEKPGSEPLGRNIQELEITIRRIIESQLHLAPPHTGIDTKSLDTPVIQILHLVLHQGDERSDHDSNTFPHKGRHLETHGLASSGRQYRKHIPAIQSGKDNILLLRTEGVVTPIFLQYFYRCHLVGDLL